MEDKSVEDSFSFVIRKRTNVLSCEKGHIFAIKFPNLYLGTFFHGKIGIIEVS